MERVAVLDLGTNTFHLLIADVETGKKPIEVYKESISAKIGEGGIAEGIISDTAFKRGINALKQFSLALKKNNPDKIRTAGTAALRAASNGRDFIEQARQEAGIIIELINGDQEAELIYEGVRQAVSLGEDPALVVDIGGGSVEFIICDKDHIFWKKSYPIGAAKLMALYHRSDPISEEDITAIRNFLEGQLLELKEKFLQYMPDTLIGSAGAFDTFAELEVLQYQLNRDLLKETEFDLNIDHFYNITDILLKTTHAERTRMPGLAEVRVDMIIVSTILTRYLLKELQIPKMKLSVYSLKEGMLYKSLS